MTSLTNSAVRKAFLALRIQTMQSALLEGRFNSIPYDLRRCMCNMGEVDDIVHYLLRCPLFEIPRLKFLTDSIARFCDRPTLDLICWLLGDVDSETTFKVEKFALGAKNIRNKFIDDL